MKNHISPLFYVGLATCVAKLNQVGAIVPPADDDMVQCSGLNLDFSRLVDITKSEMNMAASGIYGRDVFQGRNYRVKAVVPVNRKIGRKECLLQRHRLQETKAGIPIFGAEAVATVENCDPPDNTAWGGGYLEAPLSGVPPQFITMFEGKSYTEIDDPTGYVPSVSEEDAIAALAGIFQTPTDKVGRLETTIFPSYEKGDFLSYKSEVWVSGGNDIRLYDVFISAHTLEVLQICSKTNSGRVARRRNLRRQVENQNIILDGEDPNRQLKSMCGSCASQESVTWSDTEVSCEINSLYLNNENRTTTCLIGNNTNGQQVLGPGTVQSLHYKGTFDCKGRENTCDASALPTGCSDALSDAHYGVTETLKFYQEYLGVMGGLKVSANNPQSFASFVHFGNDFCNAFFTTETNNLYFGDCDCKFWTPLVALDVAAHELTHGVTVFSSGLIYSYQAGGLNEAYSDVMGTTIEYYINDSKDKPDFLMGENLAGDGLDGFILRYMETPTKDGNSIDNVCDFVNDMPVHFSSGVLNKAFTASVLSCEQSGCADRRGCVLLLGPLYMYGNIHKLTALSGYLDSAQATCSVVDEFYTARSPKTECQAAAALDFVKEGWTAVGVTLNDACAATTKGCVLPTTPGYSCIFGFQNIGGAFVDVLKWIRSFSSGGGRR